MNAKQKAGMIRFHEKAEKAYRQYGKNEEAEQAKAMREKLLADLPDDKQNPDMILEEDILY